MTHQYVMFRACGEMRCHECGGQMWAHVWTLGKRYWICSCDCHAALIAPEDLPEGGGQ